MAPKRPSPSDDPPSVSSSDDDQEPSQHLQSQDQEAESEDPDDELSGDEQQPPNQLDENNKTVSSSSAEGSDAESEPPSSQPEPAPAPAPLVDLHVRPISSKPIRSNPEATSLPAPKRAKKEDDDDASAAAGGAASDPAAGKGRQHLFNFKRLWTEEDEIVIMKGIIDYCAAKNKSFDPPNDVDAFHEFIKHNLEIKGSRKQLMNKIRKLKLKYMNNAAKGRVFSVPHEKLTYELSTKIWGSSSGGASNSVVRTVDVPKSNGKAKVMLTIKKCENVPPPAPTQNGKEIVTVVPAAQGPSNGSPPPPEKENLSESDLFRMSKGSIELDEGFVKRGIDLINDTNKLELEERWRNLQVAEMELFLRRMELVREQTKLMLDACKKH